MERYRGRDLTRDYFPCSILIAVVRFLRFLTANLVFVLTATNKLLRVVRGRISVARFVLGVC
jgi:hypothetical protein